MKKRNFIYFFILLLLVLTSCGEKKSDNQVEVKNERVSEDIKVNESKNDDKIVNKDNGKLLAYVEANGRIIGNKNSIIYHVPSDKS